jgi:hypothetical protein
MSAPQSKFQLQLPTTNTDGSPITETLSATVFVDTVNPPVKSFAVPAANMAAAVAGLVTVTFAQLGFVPVKGTSYFAGAEVSDADGTSIMSNPIDAFTYNIQPNAPTGFSVS